MLRTLSKWKEFAFEKGTSGDMVFDILKDWQEDRDCLLTSQPSKREEMCEHKWDNAHIWCPKCGLRRTVVSRY